MNGLRFEDHDLLAYHALIICQDVRTQPPKAFHSELTRDCINSPEAMAQVIMCLAVWVDFDSGLDALGDRAQAIVEHRIAETQGRFLDDEDLFPGGAL